VTRRPNFWVTVPIALAAVAGGVVGYFVTDASCAPESCTLAAVSVAVAVGFGAAVGVGVVVVLALKSLSEWQEHADRGILTETDPDAPPTPPTC
jgi:hypothetical protein